MTDQLSKTFLLVVAFMIGCTQSKNNNDGPLRISFPKIKLMIDPHKMEDAYSMATVGQVYRGLFRFNPKGDIVSDLVQSWTESKDHLKYLIKIKPSQFSDGSKILSRHVQMSFARMFFIGASMGADLDYIAGAKKFRQTKNISDLRVRPISDSEIEFELERPSALFLKHLAVVDSAVLPLNDFKDELSTTVFSGPYKVINQSEATLEIEKWRKDDLDSSKPPIKVLYSMSEKKAEELAKLDLTDSLDHYPINHEEKENLLKSGWTQTPSELVREFFVILNPNVISEATRRYLVSRVNTANALKAIGRPTYVAAFGLIPKFMPGEMQESDVDLKDTNAKVSEVKGSITLDYSATDPVEVATVNYLKSVWETPKFLIKLRVLNSEDKLDHLFKKKSEAIIGKKGVDYPDGFSVLTYFKGGYDGNYFFVNDSKIDAAIDTAVSIMDSNSRINKYRDIQKMILKHHTIIPLFFGSDASGLWSPKVKTVPPHPMGFHTLPMESVEVK
jgi:ABC-type oligopeptide transport system substrate-binding subunit